MDQTYTDLNYCEHGELIADGCLDCQAEDHEQEGQITFRELEVIALVEEFMTFEGLDPDHAFAKARAVVDGLRWYCLEWEGNALAEGNIGALDGALPF